jgi:hypothetical protein
MDYYIKKYKLNENKEIIECSLHEWGRFLETPEKIVKQEDVGDYWVSTVFLGIDHNFARPHNGEPILFESMIFKDADSGQDSWQERYCTYQEALDGHNDIVERLKNGTQPLYGDDE